MREIAKAFVDKLIDRHSTIAVVGLGYVGLPTAAWIAQHKFRVIGVDTDRRVVESLFHGDCHIREPRLDTLVERVVRDKLLTATSDLKSAVQASQVVLLCVQTPMSNGKPDIKFLKDAADQVANGFARNQEPKLILVESSVPPGTTETIVQQAFTAKGLTLGEDYWLAHSPERVAPGKTVMELESNTRVVGGVDAESTEMAESFVREAYDVQCLKTTARTAELAKLVENVARDVEIAFANEVALICEQLKVDMVELSTLVNSHPRVRILTPGVGVGGPCLPKDTYLLMHSLKAWSLAYTNLMRIARDINQKMPEHLVRISLDALAESGLKEKATISILGTTYKGDTDDSRDSPVGPVIKALMGANYSVRAYDPMTPETFGAAPCTSIEECVKSADCIMVLTDHSAFKTLDLSQVAKLSNPNPILVDGKQIYEKSRVMEAGLRLVGLGRLP